MTFEEWFIKEYNINVCKESKYRDTDTYDISECAWNAAIEASLLAAASAPAAPMGMSVWEQVEEQIKKLLTA